MCVCVCWDINPWGLSDRVRMKVRVFSFIFNFYFEMNDGISSIQSFKVLMDINVFLAKLVMCGASSAKITGSIPKYNFIKLT